MNNNGTDRDVALSIVNLITEISTLVSTINSNLFVPAIVTQPTNQEVALSGTCSFTVVAVNVAAYQWQRKTSGASWGNTSLSGNKTDTLTFTTSAEAYTSTFRCKITGKDGSIIYTDEVQVVLPETPDAEG